MRGRSSEFIRVHLWLFLSLLFAAPLHAQDTNALLNAWLESQKELRSWSADLTQTRTLKALAAPLKAEGRVWFQTPDRFRWELGQPAKTAAVRQGNDLWMLSPALKRAEHYPLDGTVQGPWRDASALLESGFPRDAASFHARYELRSFTVTNGICDVRLVPKADAARKMIPALLVQFSLAEKQLVATELTLADGSVLRNDFRNVRQNPEIPAETFAAPDPATYQITEPWKKRP